MINSYVEIYKESDKQGRLDIIKRFLDKMFPQYDFSMIDDYNVIYTRDKYQFYIMCIAMYYRLCIRIISLS